jgi:hypothetical protein
MRNSRVLAAEVPSAMQYPKRSQYKYAKKQKSRVRTWSE